MQFTLYPIALATLSMALSISACGTVPTNEYQYSVRSGSEVLTVRRLSWDGTCSTRKPSIRVVTEPANGEISVRPKTMTIGAGADLGSNNLCEGKKVIGSQVFYIPNEGFKGTDVFLLESTIPGAAGATRSNVTVRVR